MNVRLRTSDRDDVLVGQVRRAFTLVEILVVVTIIGILITMLGSVAGMTIRRAREAATTALIHKIDGLLADRMKGFERGTKSPDFRRFVNTQKAALVTSGITEITSEVIEVMARKTFFRQLFPQRFEDLLLSSPDGNSNGIPDCLEAVPGAKVSVLVTQVATRHPTESSEILYYMLSQMQSFGVPPVGESEFTTSEVRDTDGDGLLEFVDSWGRPLRFYRWPTRLLKPNGPFGLDGAPGTGGSSFLAYGALGTDDVVIPKSQRDVASMLFEGLPRGPAVVGQWDTLSEDPDDVYGSMTAWMQSQLPFLGDLTSPATVIPSFTSPLGSSAFCEPNFPTLDTFHKPLIVSLGADGDLGLFEPFHGEDSNGDGVFDTNLGILAQPIHGPGGPYDFGDTALTPNGNRTISALSDNLTNRNRRAGKGK